MIDHHMTRREAVRALALATPASLGAFSSLSGGELLAAGVEVNPGPPDPEVGGSIDTPLSMRWKMLTDDGPPARAKRQTMAATQGTQMNHLPRSARRPRIRFGCKPKRLSISPAPGQIHPHQRRPTTSDQVNIATNNTALPLRKPDAAPSTIRYGDM